MNLHFAGADGEMTLYGEVLIDMGARNRLESFYSLGKRPPSTGFNLLLDSGGFAARTRGVEIDVKKYARYIQTHGIKQAFELDTSDAAETTYNREYLVSETEATIIPVYHYSDFEAKDFKLLDNFIQNFGRYVSIGGVSGEGLGTKNEQKLYDYVFSQTGTKVRVHGLGITSLKILKKYPFYSVDSTTWLSAARYGNFRSILDADHAEWRAKNRNYIDNTRKELRYWLSIERYCTDLWKQKGIEWNQSTIIQS